MVQPNLPLVAVVGPTASGKSDVGVALAHLLGREHGRPGEVVNADAMQLYRGMDVGTAKLTPAERDGVPHHLLDVLDVTETAEVATFQADARAVVDDVTARGGTPLLVGGSGLYVRAAVDDLRFPGTDPVVRARWEAELAALGPHALHARLAERDPGAAAKILPGNGRRIVRALEVGEITGLPFAASLPEQTYLRPTLQVGLAVPREQLDARIDARVERMWAAGLVEEVRALEARGLRRGLTASRALGYAQVLAALDGRSTEDEARELTARLTRRFARKQESWFRRDPRVHWLPAPDGCGPVRPRRTGAGTAARSIGGVSAPQGLAFTKGHGTENDFVLVADPDGVVEPHRRRRRRDLRPPGRDRRRRPHPGRAQRRQPRRRCARRAGGVVHGLPQQRRLPRRDVRQRGAGLRRVPAAQRVPARARRRATDAGSTSRPAPG